MMCFYTKQESIQTNFMEIQSIVGNAMGFYICLASTAMARAPIVASTTTTPIYHSPPPASRETPP